MRQRQYYSQTTHSVTVYAADGSYSRILQDFAEGDAIAWEPTLADKVAVQDGFDSSKLSIAASRSGKITIKLKPTSPDVGFLTNLSQLNWTNPQIVNVAITTGVNEVHHLYAAAVNKGGGATGGPTMSEREFHFVGYL